MVDAHIAGPPAVPRDHREDVPRWLRRPGLLAGLEGPAVAEDAPLCPGATDVLVLSPA
jgi:hypothetical protein